ncbi:MAG: site-specific integrase [Lachnospiraceae bacterium]|nr:site-specific integrase [Lachnospiraceae bacterium]
MARKYSRASIHKTWVVMQAALKYGIRKGYIRKDFELDEIERPNENKVAIKKKNVPFIDQQDMECLYRELMSPKYGNAAKMLAFIMYSGVRISEATALTWDSVAGDYESVRIRSANSRIVERDEDLNPLKNEDGSVRHKTIVKTPKSEDGYRTIPLPTRAVEILKYFATFSEDGKGHVFVTANGTPIASDNARHCLKRALQNSKCKCKDYSPHSLRHGYGSVLISKGVDIKIVSELLGHKDVSFTYNVYIGILNEDKIKEVKRVFG